MNIDDSSRSAGSGRVPSTAEGKRNVFDWAHDIGEADRVVVDLDKVIQVRRRRRIRATLGGAALCAALALVGVVPGLIEPRTAPGRIAATSSVLRPATRTLPDGSVVELNGTAEIDVAFEAGLRRVVLRRGEAHFQVAKDAARPFVVVADGVEVRAVGTAFAVDLSVRGVEVLVTEGVVALRPGAEAEAGARGGEVITRVPPAPVLLNAGRRATVARTSVGGAAQVEDVSPATLQQRLGWRVPRLEFAETPLREVVALFNDHAALHGGPRLVLTDPKLGEQRLSGVLRADSVELLLRLLEGDFGLVADQREGELRLRPAR